MSSLYSINSILLLSVVAAPKKGGETADVRIVPGKEVKVGEPAGPEVEEVQAALLYLYNVYDKFFGAGYKLLATRGGELGRVRGLPNLGTYGQRTSDLVLEQQVAAYFDALYQGLEANAQFNVRNPDGSTNKDKLQAALKAYNAKMKVTGGRVENFLGRNFKAGTWNAINNDLKDGTVGEDPVNPNALNNTPSTKDLLGKVSNTKLRVMTRELYEDNFNLVRKESLKKLVRGAQGIEAVNVSVMIKDNDPVGNVLDDVHDLIGGVKDFYVSWNDLREEIVVHGAVNWEDGAIKKEDAEGKFKALLEANGVKADLNFENELISEIKGGIIGYATIAVLQAASGDQINLETVRAKANEVRAKRYPGVQTQQILVTPKEVPPPLQAEPEPGQTGGDWPLHSWEDHPLYGKTAKAWNGEAGGLNTSGKKGLIQALVQSGTQNDTLYIIGALFDPDPVVRIAAADALAFNNLPGRGDAVPRLVDMSMSDPGYIGAGITVRSSTVNALYAILKDSDRGKLVNLLITILVATRDGDTPPGKAGRSAAVFKLGELADPEAVPHLVPVLKQTPEDPEKLGDRDIRVLAVQALMKIHKAHPEAITDDVVAAVAALKDDKNPALVDVVSQALKQFGKVAAVPQPVHEPNPDGVVELASYNSVEELASNEEHRKVFYSSTIAESTDILENVKKIKKGDAQARVGLARGIVVVLTRDFSYENGVKVVEVTEKGKKIIKFVAVKAGAIPSDMRDKILSMSIEKLTLLIKYRAEVIKLGKLPGTKEYRELMTEKIRKM